jgi:enoyl-CoA hydratase
MVARGGGLEAATERGGFAGIVSRNFPKPVIAAVNGPALAGGFEIVLSCDLVVAADTARFGIPEVQRGLMAAAGGLIRLPKRVPLAIALELAMTGDPIDAQRALALGLVNRVVPAGDVLDAACAIADRIGENSPIAVRNSRRLVR